MSETAHSAPSERAAESVGTEPRHKINKKKELNEVSRITQLVECLPSRHKALGLILSPA